MNRTIAIAAAIALISSDALLAQCRKRKACCCKEVVTCEKYDARLCYSSCPSGWTPVSSCCRSWYYDSNGNKVCTSFGTTCTPAKCATGTCCDTHFSTDAGGYVQEKGNPRHYFEFHNATDKKPGFPFEVPGGCKARLRIKWTGPDIHGPDDGRTLVLNPGQSDRAKTEKAKPGSAKTIYLEIWNEDTGVYIGKFDKTMSSSLYESKTKGIRMLSSSLGDKVRLHDIWDHHHLKTIKDIGNDKWSCNRNADAYTFSNAQGEPLVGVEIRYDGTRRYYYRNKEDLFNMRSRVLSSNKSVDIPTVEQFMKSSCGSNSSGGCSGECSTEVATCTGKKYPTETGSMFICGCI